MAVTITKSMSRVFPRKSLLLTFTSDLSSCTRVIVYCTSAPQGSELRKQLDRANGVVGFGEFDVGKPYPYSFDAPGIYSITLEEVAVPSDSVITHGGSWLTDPNSFTTPNVLNSSTSSFSVCQKCTADLQVGQERGTLICWVDDTSVFATKEGEFVSPGESEADRIGKTPRIEAATPKMKFAVDSSAVISALAAFVGSVSSLIDSTTTSINDLIDKYNSHLSYSTVHANDDADNLVINAFKSPVGNEAISKSLMELCSKFSRHASNDSGPNASTPGGVGSASLPYHNTPHWAAYPIIKSANGPLQNSMLFADLHRCLSLHFATSNVSGLIHYTSSPALLTAKPLIALLSAVVAQIGVPSTAAPATELTGAYSLVQNSGFVKA